MSLLVIVVMAAVTAFFAASAPKSVRPLAWAGMLLFLASAAAQAIYARVIVNGGDMLAYLNIGKVLARMLETNFRWASRELWNILIQQPSPLDGIVYGGRSNTGSMFAMTAWMLFVLRGSEYGTQLTIAAGAFFACLAVFKAFRDAAPEVEPRRLFIACVLFPSVAFWTSTLHKEALCVIGIGLLFGGWRRLGRGGWIVGSVAVALGFAVIVLFRAPALPPILLGLVLHFAAARIRKMRGAEAVVAGPALFAAGAVVLLLGTLLVTRISPTLAVDTLGETVARKQQGWQMTHGGSDIEEDDYDAPQTLGAQLVRVPFALTNALFRPMIFDIHNVGTLVSAAEMTFILVLFVRAARKQGLRGLVAQMQSSPFVLMCTAVTIVGCAFVGLVTLNLGSLVRYRVPFLPFYGALLAALTAQTSKAGTTVPSKPAVAPAPVGIRRGPAFARRRLARRV